MLIVNNHGPLITSTNYWDSDLAASGKVWCSVNAGAIRVLLPPTRYVDLAEMRPARECVLSRGPWPQEAKADAIEIMWDDGSDAPFAFFFTLESFDLLPAEPEPGREWIVSTWTCKDGRAHKALERICHWRRVGKIPCLTPWSAL